MPTIKIILLILGLVAFVAAAMGNATLFDIPAIPAGLALWIAVSLLDHAEGYDYPNR